MWEKQKWEEISPHFEKNIFYYSKLPLSIEPVLRTVSL